MANKQKLRVLLITDCHYKLGGAEKCFFQLREQLKKAGLEVFSMGFGPVDEHGQDYLVLKETNNLLIRHFWRIFFNPFKYRQIRKYILEVNPDVIHLHNVNKYTVALLDAMSGFKVVQTVHDYGLVCPTQWNVHSDLSPCPTGMKLSCMAKHRRGYNWLVYLSMVLFFYIRNSLLKKRVSLFITPAPQLKHYLDKNHFRRVICIPNFVEMGDVKPAFDKMKQNQVLYIGQLEENKGVHFLIKAMKQVVEEIPSANLKIAGKGPWEKKLKYLAKELRLGSSVEFLGWIDNVNKVYEESALVVVPSVWMENAPVTVQEAMLHARAVLGSNRGGIRWFVQPGKTGKLFDITKNELAEKIIQMLQDPEKLGRYGLAGRQRIRVIGDKDRNISKIIESYKKI
ncbi:MAG: glycosyltransferase [Candidatus Woesearchaeota archaeon]